jgi:hypothetical protein
MSMVSILKSYEGKKVTVAMQAYSAPMDGILIKVTDDWFSIKTIDFNELFFDITKLVYFMERQ